MISQTQSFWCQPCWRQQGSHRCWQHSVTYTMAQVRAQLLRLLVHAVYQLVVSCTALCSRRFSLCAAASNCTRVSAWAQHLRFRCANGSAHGCDSWLRLSKEPWLLAAGAVTGRRKQAGWPMSRFCVHLLMLLCTCRHLKAAAPFAVSHGHGQQLKQQQLLS